MAESYYTTLVATFSADSDVEARLIADTIRENAQKDLEEDDEVWIDDVIDIGAPESPHAMVMRLKVARNDLISLKDGNSYEIAKELDKIAWLLERRESADSADFGFYNHTNFLRVVEAVLNGERPI